MTTITRAITEEYLNEYGVISGSAICMTALSGCAQTVVGRVDPLALGVVLPHEHIIKGSGRSAPIRFTNAEDRRLAQEPVRIENLWWLRLHRKTDDNVRLTDFDVAKNELQLFKNQGGGTVVEVSVDDQPARIEALKKLSIETGLNIIAATGYDPESAQPLKSKSASVEEVANRIKKNIDSGFGDTGIKAGIIKVFLTNNPETMEINEKDTLRAACRVQRETGAPMSIHPPSAMRAPVDRSRTRSWWAMRIIDLLKDEKTDLKRVVLCHMDSRAYDSIEGIKNVAKSGPYVEFDEWGAEWPYSTDGWEENGPFPSDYQRIKMVGELVKDGYLGRLLFSHDIWIKTLLTKYGGGGYVHILRSIVPWLRREGFTQEQLDTILIKNPQSMLTFK